MRHMVIIVGILLSSLIGVFVLQTPVSAGEVVTTEMCTVKVTFTANVPDSIEQGKSFTVTNLTVQPANSYKFTVTSSVFDMTATNTSSTAYSQNFVATDPSPTTGHNTYRGIYPNWSLNASGPVGSSVVITLKKTVTVVQGYGKVTCNFTKVLATIPIVAPAPPPPPSPAPSASVKPSVKPSSSPMSKPSASPSANVTPSVSPSVTPSPSPTSASTPSQDTISPDEVTFQSLTVVPLIIQVKNASGHTVKGAVVTLDGSQKITTDGTGRVTFSNVLTGGHAVLVSYNGKKTSMNLVLSDKDAGNVHVISLPAASQSSNLLLIGGGIAGAAILGGVGSALFIRRRHIATQTATASTNAPTVTISNIIDGSAVQAPAATTITNVPPISMSPPQPAQVSNAPWAPASPEPVTVSQPVPTPNAQIVPVPLSPVSATPTSVASVEPLPVQPGVPSTPATS